MSGADADEYDVFDEMVEFNERFQQHARHGGVSMGGVVGYHSLFNHECGIDYATHAALHAAIDEVLMEVSLDPEIVEDNQGEFGPETAAAELRAQIQDFTTIPDRFADRLAREFEEKLRDYERALGGDRDE